MALGLIVTSAILVAGAADAGLPVSPLDFSLSPPVVSEGERPAIRIDQPGPVTASPAGLFDLYLVWFIGWKDVFFLSPEGQWTDRRTAYRVGVSLRPFAPMVGRGPEASRVGWPIYSLIVVRRSADPLARANWVFQPVVKLGTVKGRTGTGQDGWPPRLALGLAGAVTLVAGLLVVISGRRA